MYTVHTIVLLGFGHFRQPIKIQYGEPTPLSTRNTPTHLYLLAIDISHELTVALPGNLAIVVDRPMVCDSKHLTTIPRTIRSRLQTDVA